MPWITSSSLQLFSCYPPLCGTKPKCVELDQLGGHWNPLAWGFSAFSAYSADTYKISHTDKVQS